MNPLEALSALRGAVPVLNPGHVWLAGAGPGDPGLLTLDALAGLAQADVVVHDALVDQRVLSLANPSAGLEYAGKRGGKPSPKQRDISERLIELARKNLEIRILMTDPAARRLQVAEGDRVAHDVEEIRAVAPVEHAEARVEASLACVVPQQPVADRVEGAHPQVARAFTDRVRHPLAHLAGGLVGEGDREDLPHRHAAVTHQVGDAMGDHPSHRPQIGRAHV